MTYKHELERAVAAAVVFLFLGAAGCASEGDESPPARPDTGAPAATTISPPAAGDGSRSVADAGADARDAATADAQRDGASATPAVASAAATWTRIYTALLANGAYASNCAGAACHDPGRQKGVDLSTAASGYRTLRAQLVPGAPDSSRLILDLTSGKMPAGRPRMPAQDVALVRAWIAAGALDN